MIPFPEKQYSIILADVPWPYKDKANAGKRGACHKYPVMSLDDICALPVASIAADDCLLFFWVTSPHLVNAQRVIEAWGFEYKTKAFNWVKYTEGGKVFFGMGNWTRSNSEDCLLAIKGKPKRQDAGISQMIRSRVLAHSVKPPIVRDLIVRLAGDLPRIELFARQTAPGWDGWGLEYPGAA